MPNSPISGHCWLSRGSVGAVTLDAMAPAGALMVALAVAGRASATTCRSGSAYSTLGSEASCSAATAATDGATGWDSSTVATPAAMGSPALSPTTVTAAAPGTASPGSP